MQDALNNNYQGMTHTGRKPQGLQFAQDIKKTIGNAPNAILKWVQNNPVDAAFMAASTAPIVGDAIGFGKDVYDMSPMGDTPFTATNTALAGAGLLPFVPAGMGSIKKTAGSMADALNPDRAASIINNSNRTNAMRQNVGDMARVLMDKVESANIPNQKTGNIDVPYTSRKVTPEYVNQLNSGLTVTDNGLYEPIKFLKPENLQHDNSSILSMAWDRANVGDLSTVAGRKLNEIQKLDGGNAYPRGYELGAGASGSGPINRAVSAVKRQEGKPLYSMFSSMGGEATDFSVMGVNTVLDGFNPKLLNVDDVTRFNDKFLALKGSPGLKISQDSFPGLESKKLRSWLNESGGNRYAFMKHLDKSEWNNLGFPDVAAARHAVTDPTLLNLPNGIEGYGGHSISLMDPNAVKRSVNDTPNPHTTYPYDVPKISYEGQLPAPVPRSLSFPKWYQGRRDIGALPRSDNKSFEFQTVVQPVDNNWVDSNSLYQEEFFKELAKRTDEKGLLKGLLR